LGVGHGKIEKRGVNSWRLVVETGYDANTKRLKRCKSIKIDGPALLKTIPIFFISSAAPKNRDLSQVRQTHEKPLI
jgi:hypothetical protein